MPIDLFRQLEEAIFNALRVPSTRSEQVDNREFERVVKDYRLKLEQAVEKIREQQRIISGLREDKDESTAFKYGTVVYSEGSSICVSVGGDILIFKDVGSFPSGTKIAISEQGSCYKLPGEFPSFGNTRTIAKKLPNGKAEVETPEGTMIVLTGELEVEDGDRVILDSSEAVCVENLGKTNQFSVDKPPSTMWSDIGGLDDAKADLIEAIELPSQYPELFEAYNRTPPKGIILYGPPGCGKTMLAKAAANSLARIHNVKDASGFIYVKGPEVLRKYVGESEGLIRSLFQKGREHYRKNGYPAIMFLDEADALLSRRGSGISSDVEKTIVPTFLSEMDGLEESGVFVMIATNRPDVLDPAVVRDGRIDRKIYVPRPDVKGAIKIFNIYFDGKPLVDSDAAGMSAMAAGELFSSKRKFFSVTTRSGKSHDFCLSNIVNGAMIANVVNLSVSLAIRRDITKGNTKKSGKHGISKDDVMDAVNTVFEQNKELDHKDALEELNESLGKDRIVGVND
ncbi:MAG: AAA family ATPase [bacterium]